MLYPETRPAPQQLTMPAILKILFRLTMTVAALAEKAFKAGQPVRTDDPCIRRFATKPSRACLRRSL